MWNLLIVVWVPYFSYASDGILFLNLRFENDVKMYGTQTCKTCAPASGWFENDVKMYGTQTRSWQCTEWKGFENDVKMYGTQTKQAQEMCTSSLRMM